MGLTNEEPITLVRSSEPSKEPTTRSSEPSEVEVKKSKVRSLLKKHYGLTTHPDVIEAIEELAKLNPCTKNASKSSDFLGDFCTLTAPNFPGRIGPEKGREDVVQYTLGRLSFNLFQPNKLVCTLKSVYTPIKPRENKQDDKETYTYNIISNIVIHTDEGDLPAHLISEAYCYESPDVNNRLMVSFTGGTLVPKPEEGKNTFNEELWVKTFEGAYSKADKERSFFGWIFQYFITFLLGITLPSDASFAKHSFHFDMKRSPVGHFDLLFLDEDMRITRGNRGTIVVAERANTVPAQ